MKLGDLVSIKHGFAFKGEFFSTHPTQYVLLTPGNFHIGGGFKSDKNKYYNGPIPSEYILKQDDLIVTMTDLSKEGDTLGYSALIPSDLKQKYLHNQRIGLVQINKPDLLDKHYLYWFLRTRNYHYQIVGSATGSTVKHTSPSRICDIEITLPSLHQQKRVSNILDNIEQKIGINNKINDNLATQAMLYYKQLISTNALSKCNLGDIASIIMGQSPSGSSYNEEGKGLVFYQGRTDFGFRFPTRRVYTTKPKKIAEKNDVLLSVRAPVGDINVANESCCIGRGLCALRSLYSTPSFLYYTMDSLRPQLNQFNGGGTIFGSINQASLNSLQIHIPAFEQIKSFETKAAPLDAMIMNNNNEILRIASLRDFLLPRLMSGEIPIEN